MEITRNQQGELASGPSIPPPEGNVCFINNLPPELLSRIFELGSDADCALDDLSSVFVLEEDETIDPWDFLRSLDGDSIGEEHVSDNDTERTGELEDGDGDGDDVQTSTDDSEVDTRVDDEEGEGGSDEAEIDDEGDLASATGSSNYRPAFQILISRVCSLWREVAFNTPSLWTTIGVTPTAGVSCGPVLTLLRRSKDLPIDICVNCNIDQNQDGAAPPFDHELRSLFSIFIPHVHRWRKMTIGASEYHFMHEFLQVASGPSISAAPQLMTFELYYNRATAWDSDSYLSTQKRLTFFGGSAPSLTTIVLWGVSVDWDQQWIASASKLRDLTLALHSDDRPSWTQFATILRGAPALEKFTLCDSGPSGDPSEWLIEFTPGSPADLNSPILLPRLKELVLKYYSQASAIQLLRKLRLPALRNLVLEFYNDDYTDFVYELAMSIVPSSSDREQPRSLLSRLERFALGGLFCDQESVSTLYGELQNLTTLKVPGSPSPYSVFLDTLFIPCTSDRAWSDGAWLPRLATLHVCDTAGETIRSVVQRRKDIGVPLSTLYLETSCTVDHEDVKWLAENVQTLRFIDKTA